MFRVWGGGGGGEGGLVVSVPGCRRVFWNSIWTCSKYFIIFSVKADKLHYHTGKSVLMIVGFTLLGLLPHWVDLRDVTDLPLAGCTLINIVWICSLWMKKFASENIIPSDYFKTSYIIFFRVLKKARVRIFFF